MLFRKDRTITWTMEEFLDPVKRAEVEKKHKKDVLTKYLKIGGNTLAIAGGIVTIGGVKYYAIAIPAKALVNTVVACSSSTMVVPTGFDAFNNLVIAALNKLYAGTCMGALAVESVQTGSYKNSQKFTSALSKYSLCYAGGLFILYSLHEMKNLTL